MPVFLGFSDGSWVSCTGRGVLYHLCQLGKTIFTSGTCDRRGNRFYAKDNIYHKREKENRTLKLRGKGKKKRKRSLKEYREYIHKRGISQVALVVKNLPAYSGDIRDVCGFDTWVRKIPWRRAWQPTPVILPGESPWTEETGSLQSIGMHQTGHD